MLSARRRAIPAAKADGMRRPDGSARGIPSSRETVLSSSYRRIREQLITCPKRWLIPGVAGFMACDPPEALRTFAQEVVGPDDSSARYLAEGDGIHNDRVRRLPGYAPKQSLDDALTEVLPWYLSRFGESLLGARFNRFHAARY